MTAFLVTTVILLILGCILTKAMTNSLTSKSRQELAEISAEVMKAASQGRLVEANLKILQDREREAKRDLKKLNTQLSEIQTQLEETKDE